MTPQTIQVTNPETGEVRNFSEAEYIAERDRLLMEWQRLQGVLAAAKEDEMRARKLAVAFMHDPSKTGTTENVDLGNGWKAKMKVPVRYGFVVNAEGRTDKKRIEQALGWIESTGADGELIADRLVKWTPELSLTEYKQLPDHLRKAIDDVIVTTEGSPTLEIVEPKSKK